MQRNELWLYGQANAAWALGKLSHFHQGLLDAIAVQAAAMVQVGSLSLRIALLLLATHLQ